MRINQRLIKKIVLIVMVLMGGSGVYQNNFQDTPIGQEVSGFVTNISDGDTIRINGIKIRLWGVDAPEKNQPGFQEAGDFLRQEFQFSSVSCLVHARDNFSRLVAQCTRDKDDQDVGALIIRSGKARDYKRYSKGYYLPQQILAQKDQLGVWKK
jgi:micrococcal nuclease